MHIAVAGDLHGQWDSQDQQLLRSLGADALLLVGDFSDGQQRIPALLRQLPLPAACVLGNHDTGKDASGRTLQSQIDLLGELHCGWGLRLLQPPGLAVVGARPGSAGGGYHLSKAVQAVYGPVPLEESVARIVTAALAAPPEMPLLLLAHCGPSGLGSGAADPCGRDWKAPACDWGDQDLAVALATIRRKRPVPLVVFGHMHHRLRRHQGERQCWQRDRAGTLYFNAACVPRHGQDDQGRPLRHFGWLEFNGTELVRLSQRWTSPAGQLLYEDLLWQAPQPSLQAA